MSNVVGPNIPDDTATLHNRILAAMSITDQLFRERAAQRDVAEEMQSLAGELRRWLPPGKRGEGAV